MNMDEYGYPATPMSLGAQPAPLKARAGFIVRTCLVCGRIPGTYYADLCGSCDQEDRSAPAASAAPQADAISDLEYLRQRMREIKEHKGGVV